MMGCIYSGGDAMDCSSEPDVSDHNNYELGENYLEQHSKILELFGSWSKSEQVDFMEQIMYRMDYNQIGNMYRLIRPLLQRDFIATLPEHLTDVIFEKLDAKTFINCEAVSSAWKMKLAKGQVWKKLIEGRFRTDNLWKALSEKRQWRKFVLIGRGAAQSLICRHFGEKYSLLKGTNKIIMLQHKFYKELYSKITEDLAKLEHNWMNGKFKMKTIRCDSLQTKGVYSIQYDDEKIISGHRENSIKIWNRDDLSCKNTLLGHTGSVLCLQYNQKFIFSASSDATVRIWDINTGECLNTLTHHHDAVLHLAFNDNMLITSSKDRSIAVWDMVSHEEINIRRVLLGHRSAVNVVDFDDKYIISGSGDRTIKVWATDKLEFIKSLSGHKRGIACMHFKGDLLATGSSDNTIRLWSINVGVCLRVLEGHEELVRCIRFDNKRIISGSYNGKMKIWDLQAALDVSAPADTLCLTTLQQHTGRVFRLQFDDFQIISSSHDDTIRIWDMLDAEDDIQQ